ncbi:MULTISPECIES: hypothetical protein [unclassified Moorena]|nr:MULTISPECIES: hypothetical protein [unclassified Moorena]
MRRLEGIGDRSTIDDHIRYIDIFVYIFVFLCDDPIDEFFSYHI